MPVKATRGELITIARNGKHLTKTALARITGLSRNYIGMIEADKADNLSEQTLFSLADALGVDVCRLLLAAREMNEDEHCDHCWHYDGTILVSNPVQYQLVCCHCGKRAAIRVNPQDIRRDNEHGEHMNEIPVQYRK